MRVRAVQCAPLRAWCVRVVVGVDGRVSTCRLSVLSSFHFRSVLSFTHLERSSHAENTVVSLLGRETLERGKDSLGLLGDQVVGSAFGIEISFILQYCRLVDSA